VTVVDGGEAFIEAQHLTHRLFVFANSAATFTGQVAGMKGFQHQNQWKMFGFFALLPADMLGDCLGLDKWKSHSERPVTCYLHLVNPLHPKGVETLLGCFAMT